MSRTDGRTGQLIGVRCFSLCNTQGCLLRTNKILNEILSKCHNINILSKQYRGGPQHPRPRFKKIELELRCISVEWEIGPEMPSCWPTVNRRGLLRSERGPGTRQAQVGPAPMVAAPTFWGPCLPSRGPQQDVRVTASCLTRSVFGDQLGDGEMDGAVRRAIT